MITEENNGKNPCERKIFLEYLSWLKFEYLP